MNTQNLINLQNLQEIENLEFLAKQVVEGFIIGLHKSPYHGFSVEFAEHRLYNPGESTKNIDWKVFARTDRLYVKKYEEETNLRCQLVIDGSSSMYYSDENKNVSKVKFAAVASAALMHLLRKQRDAAGLSIFSDEVKINTKAKASPVHHNLLHAHLEQLLDTESLNHKTAAAKSLHEIAEHIHKRSLVVIFSDMMDNLSLNENGTDNSEELFSALQHLKYNKHEVILFHVTNKKREQEFEFENRPYIFVDMETNEKVKLHSNQVKDYYVEQMAEFTKKIKLKCAQYQIDFVEADVNRDFSQVLIPYLVKRTKMF